MGRLIYSPTSSFDIEDRLLYHLRIVMMNKLRRSESFMLQMATEGGGRTSIWIAPDLRYSCSSSADGYPRSTMPCSRR